MRIGVFTVFFVVGIAPWLLVNGLWSEVRWEEGRRRRSLKGKTNSEER